MAKKRVDKLPAWERAGSMESQMIGLTLAEAVALAAQTNMMVEVLEIRDGMLGANMNIDPGRIRVGLARMFHGWWGVGCRAGVAAS